MRNRYTVFDQMKLSIELEVAVFYHLSSCCWRVEGVEGVSSKFFTLTCDQDFGFPKTFNHLLFMSFIQTTVEIISLAQNIFNELSIHLFNLGVAIKKMFNEVS